MYVHILLHELISHLPGILLKQQEFFTINHIDSWGTCRRINGFCDQMLAEKEKLIKNKEEKKFLNNI